MPTRFLLLMLLGSVAACQSLAPQPVTIIAINDVYRIEGVDGGKRGGLPKVAALRHDRNVDLLLHAGDFLYPALLSRVYKGEQMVDVMNSLDGAPGVFDPFMFVVFGNHEFDAIWCANALEYLDDEELVRALEEFVRVLRPGGVLGTNDWDAGLFLFSPGDPTLPWRAWAAGSQVARNFQGCLRTRSLRRWFEKAGLTDTWQRATLSEIWAPLQPVQRTYIGGQLMQIGALAEKAGVPESDLEFWRAQRDPSAPEAMVNHPELFWCEGHFVTVGRCPT